MITAHHTFDNKISADYFELIADRVGYDGYIPYRFVDHVMCAFSFYKFDGNPNQCVVEQNDYTDSFKQFLRLINFDSVKTNNPVEFAFRLLKLYQKRFNFRKLEAKIQSKKSFSVDEYGDLQTNYVIDLNELTSLQRSVLEISEDENLDTVELSQEVIQLLKFYSDVLFLEPTFETNYNPVKQRIQSYSDFYKGRKYRLALPSFKSDLGLKKLDITKVNDVEDLGSKSILAIDFSLSMLSNPSTKNLIRSALLYYMHCLERQPALTLDIVIVVNGVYDIIPITSIDELKLFYKTLHPFILATGLPNFLSELNSLYAGESIIFISDGSYKVNPKIPLHYTLHTVCLSENIVLRNICNGSGGKFILLS